MYHIGYIALMDSVLAAISDESRRTVLRALSEGPATVTELAALLPIARPGVSRHLRVLREAGLVEYAATPSAGFTPCDPSRSPRSTNGSSPIGRSGPTGWTRSTPRSRAASARIEIVMTDNDLADSRILGALRKADGRAIIHVEDVYPTTSTTSGRPSVCPSA